VTPANYVVFLQTYNKILSNERKRISQLREGYQGGVEKLESSSLAIQKLQQDLNEKQP
jgi:hypothetical protein